MHYYKRNIGDYSKKAGRLTMLQHGAYTLLLDSCYDRERFPTLDEAIEWTWASTESEVEAVKFVLSRFFKLDGDGQYVQDRILDELLHYHKNADTNKRIALEREAKRKGKSTNRAQSVNEAPPNQEPLTINQEPTTKKDKKGASAEIVFPDGLDQQAWTRWLEYRKASGKSLKPVSWSSAMQSLAKHGDQQSAVVDQSIANGWQGLFAIKQDTGKQSKTTTFAERDAAAGRKRWEEMTGRKWPENETFIDADTFTLGIEHDTTD
jgi:uncharacterized protein YdaU (DUF1376 family)